MYLLTCGKIKQISIMENVSILFQLIVSISVFIVWIFRYDNIVVEFKDYGYSDLLRNFVGVAKTSTSTLLILGLWYNEITIYASLSMAFFMLCAQLSHIKVKNPFIKFVPSLIFLIMSLFIASFNCGLI
tara:strand:+ start:1001 stop:1387 length:387 start_codon:yes stop_codon:yes gene_type:complete